MVDEPRLDSTLPYADPATRPAGSGRSFGTWVTLLLVWAVGLIVWVIYLCAIIYAVVRFL